MLVDSSKKHRYSSFLIQKEGVQMENKVGVELVGTVLGAATALSGIWLIAVLMLSLERLAP